MKHKALLIGLLIAAVALVATGCAVESRGSVERVGQVNFITSDMDPVINMGNLGNRIDFDADNDTSIRASADDTLILEAGGVDAFQVEAAAVTANVDLVFGGTTPLLTLGDGDAEDATLLYNGVQDFYIANDDSADDLVIGVGSVVGTTQLIAINTTDIIFGDADTDTDVLVLFDGGQQDYYLGLDDTNDDFLIGFGGVIDTTEVIQIDSSADLTLGEGQSIVIADVPGAGASGDLIDITDTLTAMDGTDAFILLDVNLTQGAHTGTGNDVTGIDLAMGTGDVQAHEVGLKISGGDIAADFGSEIVVSTGVSMFDDFDGVAVDPDFVHNSGGQASDCVLTVAQNGTCVATSEATDDSFANDHVGIDTSGVMWSADQGGLVFETRLNLTDITTSQTVCFGFTDTVTDESWGTVATDTWTITADDTIAFCFDDTGTTDQWTALATDSVGGDATGIGVVGVAPANTVFQTFRIVVESSTDEARFYIDGSLVATLTGDVILETTLMTPFFVLDNSGAGADVVTIDYIAFWSAR
ncbi:hypothetical protein LCGC14_1287750 [marine sediment metagenome]|uniref:SRCR domain-containing protein n=1 Tax=marine sediment metagenome TaxID=412755 RepID=A0A0F9KUZ7_9ZZZZ